MKIPTDSNPLAMILVRDKSELEELSLKLMRELIILGGITLVFILLYLMNIYLLYKLTFIDKDEGIKSIYILILNMVGYISYIAYTSINCIKNDIKEKYDTIDDLNSDDLYNLNNEKLFNMINTINRSIGYIENQLNMIKMYPIILVIISIEFLYIVSN